MRVLLIYPRELIPNVSTGGVVEFIHELTTALLQLNVEPIIYAGTKFYQVLSEVSYLPNKVKVYHGPILKPNFFYCRKKLQPLLKLCQMENIQLLHAQGLYTAGFMALQIYKRLNIPYVVTSHSDVLPSASKRILRGRVRNRCYHILKHAASVTHLTPIMQRASHDILNTTHKDNIIGNGVNTALWKSVDYPLQNFLLGIGRLEYGKGFHILIKMYAALLQKNVNTTLVIAGDGGAKEDFIQLATQLKLNVVMGLPQEFPEKSIVFTGYIRGEDKIRLMQQSKMILFPIQPHLWEEAFGIVQLEAMAASKVLVASDTEITRYLMSKGLQAKLIPATDVNAWERVVGDLLITDSVCQELGKINFTAAQQFSWYPIAKQYRDVYFHSASKCG